MAGNESGAQIPVTGVSKAEVSPNGQMISIKCKGAGGEEIVLNAPWELLGSLIQLLSQSAKEAQSMRRAVGSDDMEWPEKAIVISDFSVGMTTYGSLAVLTLTSPDGLRFDFGVPPHIRNDEGDGLVDALSDVLEQSTEAPPSHH